MWSKVDIRNMIDREKDNYNKHKDKIFLVKAAILKGLYIALDGKKGIPLPNKFESITIYSKIIFRYRLKFTNKDRAYGNLYNSLLKIGKIPEYFLNDKIPSNNNDLAEMLILLITSDDADDIIINQSNIYQITLSILDEMEK